MAEAEAKYPTGWIVVDTVIPGCTEEMIDWWWVNMEKGYELWCPDEHKGFKWEVPPPVGGHIGAVQIATESIDYGPVRGIRIEFVDPNIGTAEQKDFWTYRHLLAIGRSAPEPGGVSFVNLSHQWEAIPGGCKMRSCMHGFPGGRPPGAPPGGGPPGGGRFGPPGGGPPGGGPGFPPPGPHPSGKKPTGGGWGAHAAVEGATFKVFLPVLWALWQAMPDPAINRQASLKIKKEGGKIIYVK
jgi:hypothetical protein